MGLNKRITLRNKLIFVVSSVGLLVCIAVSSVGAATISQGFQADSALTRGALVSTKPTANNTVVYANVNNAEQLIGVVVSSDATPIAVSTGTNQIQVATSGIASVFVTNRSGNIKRGDQIAPSLINGVGAKALGNGRVIGVAQADFDGTGSSVTKRTIGNEEILIGDIPVLLNVGSYVVPSNSALDSLVPQALQDIAQRIAGGQAVSSLKILLSLAALLIGVVSSTIIMYGAIKAGIISIGRNPLSGTTIRRNLMQVLGAGLTILTLSIIGSYFILIW